MKKQQKHQQLLNSILESNGNINISDIEASIKSNQSKQLLSSIAQSMIEDFNEFSNSITNINNSYLEMTGEVVERFIQVAAEEKKKVDNLKINEKQILEKVSMINSIKEKFNLSIDVEKHLSQ